MTCFLLLGVRVEGGEKGREGGLLTSVLVQKLLDELIALDVVAPSPFPPAPGLAVGAEPGFLTLGAALAALLGGVPRADLYAVEVDLHQLALCGGLLQLIRSGS